MGSGILSTEKMVFLDKTKLALRLATKVASIKDDSVHKRVKMTKAELKMAFCLMKTMAGDHTPEPAMKMPASTRLMRPLKVRQEFINSRGFLAWGKNRVREEFKPSMLNKARKLIADIMAELKPTSASV